ncbi:hypothetical protein [Paenibacillus caui]|uniref:hypothetical protein n=1 Tax=Paenibacillus caui TaxID=2873927 RepID=UPI001CA7DF97|nr:hypothetical protein [Paenibacillus caui]
MIRRSLMHNAAAPPMTEGIVQTEGGLYVLFESGAASYRSNGAYPLDHLYLLDCK